MAASRMQKRKIVERIMRANEYHKHQIMLKIDRDNEYHANVQREKLELY